MFQLILTIFIILTAIGLTIWKAIRYFRNPNRECEDCALGCNGCSLEELKKEIEQKKHLPKSA
ncbi:MAG: hypothetical protein NTX61_17960 [Bacteroidetes bacterium]|nr:hypothetical protein [Bacteroidota bacterium]